MEINAKGRRSRVTGVAIGGLVFVMAACLGGAAGAGVGLFRLFGETKLSTVATFGICCALVVGTHAVVIWWAIAARPGRASVVATQVPYLMTYCAFAVWWPDPWWPLGYLAWGWAACTAVGVLTAWWLHGLRSGPRRAIVYLCALAVLVGGNTIAVGAHVWTRTRGFGLAGELTPSAAVQALEATSCLSDTGDFYHKAGEMTLAECPTGENHHERYEGVHDEEFDELITSDQPRAAWEKWWTVQNVYGYFVELRFKLHEQQEHGETVVMTFNVEFA
ncbi:hypothetical protein, partial [Catellatospora citrea]